MDDQRVVSYAEYGVSDGRPVVFLHGTPGSHLLGALFDDAARRNGVRLIAPDRPGYGRSTPWPGRTLRDTGTFVTAVLDHAGVSSAGAVGFSGGGPHALALAATHGGRVESVDIVAGATPPALEANTPAVRRVLATMAHRTPSLLSGLLRVQGWVARRASPAVVVSQYTTAEGVAELDDGVAELVRRDFAESVEGGQSGAVTEFRLLADTWDVPLERVGHPVRLWHGEKDTNVPVDAARGLADRLPDATMTTLRDADHLTSLLRSRSQILNERP
ncbi:alpha/beta hydrolase [Haloprofundus marisrubri]|uniref:Alpha/beta hydrolase n=1 Tax=Haloprofundus marisrubri TaxID=1514971 RepID=A0A0W1R845_9EURY|nr:alpha/beta hydrolase [Haloprofundus marisrubri]